jgi:DNA-binding transcriptional regulator GbsR (MarR family)
MAPEDPNTAAKLQEAELAAAEAIGTLIEFWGFKRQMGRIWTLLYLSDEPLAAAEICDRLQLSAGAASMTLAELEHWGVVQRTRKAGDRRDFFSAETDIWKMVSRVWRERELRQIERAMDAFEKARRLVEPLARGPAGTARARFKLERLRTLGSLARLGEALATMALDQGKLDLSPLRVWRTFFANAQPPRSPDEP